MKTKSNVLWIDPELVAQKMKDNGFNNRYADDDNLDPFNDHDGWTNTLMDVLEDMYSLETYVHDQLERIK